MPWSRLCDQFDIDQKILDLEPATIAYFIGCLSWCNRNMTDGRIEKAKAKNILRLNGKQKVVVRRAVKELLDAGLWADIGDHFQVVSYLKFNKSRSVLLREKEQNRVKIERWRAGKCATKATTGDNRQICNLVTPGVSNPAPDPDPDLSVKEDPKKVSECTAWTASEAGSADATRHALAVDASSLTPPESFQEHQSLLPMPGHPPGQENSATALTAAPESICGSAHTLDLTAEHLAAPVDLVLDRAQLLHTGAMEGLPPMPFHSDLPKILAICPVRRAEFREAHKAMMKSASKPCWSYLVSIITNRRKKHPRRPEPSLNLGKVEPSATEVIL